MTIIVNVLAGVLFPGMLSAFIIVIGYRCFLRMQGTTVTGSANLVFFTCDFKMEEKGQSIDKLLCICYNNMEKNTCCVNGVLIRLLPRKGIMNEKL